MDLLLRGLRVQTLLVTGAGSNGCVLSATSGGFQLCCHIRVLEACRAGTTSQDERRAALLIIRALTMGRPVCPDELICALAAVHQAT